MHRQPILNNVHYLVLIYDECHVCSGDCHVYSDDCHVSCSCMLKVHYLVHVLSML
ncbi:Low-molecular-weight cysteine-rich protein LCR68 [Zea mays]|uniref:Low-molecular-weight cysteine-rich protein LCR68 n=1 Tax=Zea mays TaxID=4577 RepID=A0A1D6EET9_MAIZE|nr:Low-molecular-weight cysteine-rich protein LCR68 [Zea mays]